MCHAVLRRASGFVFGELQEVVVEAIGGSAVITGPEGGLRYGGTAAGRHGDIVVRGAADHVCVGFDVSHGRWRLDIWDWILKAQSGSVIHDLRSTIFSWPGTAGTLCGGGGDGVVGGIAEDKQHALCGMWFFFAEFFDCQTECFHAEIIRAIGAGDAVEECRDIDEFVADFNKIEVEYFLSGHGFIME